MAELIDILDGGVTKDENGNNVGIVILKISYNEGVPENLIVHCLPNYRDSEIKNLRRLAFQKNDFGN